MYLGNAFESMSEHFLWLTMSTACVCVHAYMCVCMCIHVCLCVCLCVLGHKCSHVEPLLLVDVVRPCVIVSRLPNSYPTVPSEPTTAWWRRCGVEGVSHTSSTSWKASPCLNLPGPQSWAAPYPEPWNQNTWATV